MIRIEYAPEFKRNLQRLARKYHHIQEDVNPLLERLQRGELVGQRVPRMQRTVLKVRLPNRDARRGTRGGYRCLYYLKSSERFILLTIYAKSEKADLTNLEVRRIFAEIGE